MQSKLSAVLAAVILGTASLSAMAQPQPGQPGHPGHPGAGPQGGPGAMQHPAQRPAPVPQVDPRKPAPAASAHGPQHRPPQGHSPGHAQQRHGAGPDHQWTKGSRVPPQYRSQHYVVKDWQRHGLKKPGRGQQWVQNGNDYLLVAVASGVIAQIVFGH